MTGLFVRVERCKRCGVCVDLCPGKVYENDGQGYPVPSHIEKCTGCGLCELWCPDYAIELTEGVAHGPEGQK